MLALSRKTNERIRIGDDIVIEVAKIFEKRVVLGIDAPLDMEIHREEVYQDIQENGRRGGKVTG